MDKRQLEQIEQMIDGRTPLVDGKEITAVHANWLATASVARALGMTPQRLEKVLRKRQRNAVVRRLKPKPRGREALTARQKKARRGLI